jgi:hypothetical protein
MSVITEWWPQVQGLIGDYTWIARIIALAAFIMLMVMVVALLYSGEVQNSEKGPISIIGKTSLPDDAFQAQEPIVTNNLDGKRAVCTVFMSYLDRRGRPKRKRIYRHRFLFKKLNRSPIRDKTTLVGFWNSTRHDAIVNALQEAEIVPDAPNLLAAATSPGESPHIDEYFNREIAETKTIAVSNTVAQAISRAHCQFLTDTFAKIQRIKRNRQGIRKLDGRPEFESLPNVSEDAHYFVEMKFDISPWFVLMDHPDGQVKTTAWLTVLTSLFAMFMQVIYNGIG